MKSIQSNRRKSNGREKENLRGLRHEQDTSVERRSGGSQVTVQCLRDQEQEEVKEETTEHIVENDEQEEDEDETEEKPKAKGRRKASTMDDQSESKRPKKEREQNMSQGKEGKDPATPASERPTRDRKTVERFSIPSPAKSGKSSASKALLIEKGRV